MLIQSYHFLMNGGGEILQYNENDYFCATSMQEYETLVLYPGMFL